MQIHDVLWQQLIALGVGPVEQHKRQIEAR
jgi:hypothetical protein